MGTNLAFLEVAIRTGDIVELSRIFDQAKEANVEAQRQAKESASALEQVRRRLWDEMQTAGLGNFTRDDGVQYIRKSIIYPSVKDKKSLISEIRSLGLDVELLSTEVKIRPFREWYREKLDRGEPIPPGATHYVKETISRLGGSGSADEEGNDD